MVIDCITKYFPDLTDLQKEQFEALMPLYQEWNSQINVISRKDIDNLYLHHVLHSLAIAKWVNFVPGTHVMDVGCGGGFPGLPLAILYPEVIFDMVDSIRKKLKVVDAVAEAIGLQNISTHHSRVEERKDKYDFIITRAVAQMPLLLSWSRKNISNQQKNATPNGIIALKGGKLDSEMNGIKKQEYCEIVPLTSFFEEDFFDEKYLVYVQL